MSLTLDASSVDPDKPSLIEPSESDSIKRRADRSYADTVRDSAAGGGGGDGGGPPSSSGGFRLSSLLGLLLLFLPLLPVSAKTRDGPHDGTDGAGESEAEKGKLPAKHSIKRRADRSYADTVRDSAAGGEGMSLTLDASSVDPDKPSLIEPSESDPSEESPDEGCSAGIRG
jgi:hypothetical protein